METPKTLKNPVQPETEPKPLFVVTLMRHEEPYYKDEGHDLTQRGVENAVATGRKLAETGHFSEADELYLLHSPKPRAKGTLDFVAEGAGVSDVGKRSIDQLRQVDIKDQEAFLSHIKDLGFDQEAIAKDVHTNPDFWEHNPEVVEPTTKRKARLYRALEYLIRWVDKHPGTAPNTPHVLAVSHFEIITNLIDDVFGIEKMGQYNKPSFGEMVIIKARHTKDPNRIELDVSFGEHTKTVEFDRNKREVVIP